jgi:hypothetical protein
MSTSIVMGSEVGGVSLPLSASTSMSEDSFESGVFGICFCLLSKEAFVDSEDGCDFVEVELFLAGVDVALALVGAFFVAGTELDPTCPGFVKKFIRLFCDMLSLDFFLADAGGLDAILTC